MPDPINYLAGFNPAQSILQSIQGGIQLGLQGGGPSKEELAMQREKMQMGREEFALNQQLKREQMQQQKTLHDADLELKKSQSVLNESLKKAQIAEADAKQAARQSTQISFEEWNKNPTAENLLNFQSRAAISHPESVAASTQASQNFAKSVGQDVAANYSRALSKGSQLLSAGKFDEASSHFSDYSKAMEELGMKTQNQDAVRASKFLNDFSTISEESKASPELGKAAVGKIAELALGDPLMMKHFQEMANLEKTRAETELTRSKVLGGEGVEIKDVTTKKLLADTQDLGNKENQRLSSISDIISKIESGEVKLPEKYWDDVAQSIKDKIPFFATDVTMLRKQYVQIANSEAVKNLPPGSASNQDVKFAREGIMDASTNKDKFLKGLKSMQRLSDIAVKYYDAKSEWISKNGNIGSLSADRSINGKPVKKGTGFNEWWREWSSSRSSDNASSAKTPLDEAIISTEKTPQEQKSSGSGTTRSGIKFSFERE